MSCGGKGVVDKFICVSRRTALINDRSMEWKINSDKLVEDGRKDNFV